MTQYIYYTTHSIETLGTQKTLIVAMVTSFPYHMPFKLQEGVLKMKDDAEFSIGGSLLFR